MSTLDFSRIRHIGVFRALMLGDLLCAVPALRAIAHACPQAQITLIGLPWARELAGRLPMVHDFVEFPGYPGLPEREPKLQAWPGFRWSVRERRFDLLIQLHGSGRLVNPLVRGCGARQTAGFYDRLALGHPGQPSGRDPLYLPWPEGGHEIVRLLRLTRHLGMPDHGTELEYPVQNKDRRQLEKFAPGLQRGRPYVCVHPGAQLPSRRWAPQRFAEVADCLAARGYTVVLTGSAAEVELVGAVAAAMREPGLNLAGQTTLWTLGALIDGAALLVCNDTGVSHIAAALRTPSVVVSCGSDVSRWAPLDTSLHRVIWRPVPCRPCDNAVCPTGHECAHAVPASEVAAAAEAVLPPRRMAPLRAIEAA